MMRCVRNFTWAAVLAGIGVMIAAPPAKADFRLRMEDTTNTIGVVLTAPASGTVFLTENPVPPFGDIATMSPGSITYIGDIGPNFTGSVTTGLSKPNIGVPNSGAIDLNTVTISASSAGTLRITLEDDNFNVPANGVLNLMNSIGGTLGFTNAANASITAQGWANPGNLTPALGVDTFPDLPLGPIGGIPGGSVQAFTPAFTAGPGGAFSGTGTNTFTKAGPYSLFLQVTITFAGAGSVSFNDELHADPAPEPGTGLVALTSLPLMGGFFWLRRRKARA
jgi:hypothetical protein